MGGEPYIGINDILPDDSIDLSSCRRVSPDVIDKQMKSFRISDGDIVFGKIGTIGQPTFLPVVQYRYGLSANVVLIKPKIPPNFVMSFLKSELATNQIRRQLHTTSQPAFGIQRIRTLLIPLPPLAEQRKIAAILSTWDEAITLTEQLITALQRRKQALMQLLLTGAVRFPVFEGQEWENITTEQIIVENGMKIGPFGSQLKKSDLAKSGYKVYGQENVFSDNFVLGDRYLDAAKFASLKACEIVPGDVLVTMMGTVGKTAIVPEDIEPGIMDSHLLRLRVDSALYSKQLLIQLIQNSDLIKRQIESLSVGGIMDGLSSKIVRQLIFPHPPLDEQQRIADLLNLLDKEIALRNQYGSFLETQKHGLMQQLLTGLARVQV